MRLLGPDAGWPGSERPGSAQSLTPKTRRAAAPREASTSRCRMRENEHSKRRLRHRAQPRIKCMQGRAAAASPAWQMHKPAEGQAPRGAAKGRAAGNQRAKGARLRS